MIRIILGIIVGFVVWMIVWVGSEQTFAALSPDWLGQHMRNISEAMKNGSQLETPPMIAVVNLLRGFLVSLIAGYITALVAGEYKRSTVIVGILLIVFGVWQAAAFPNLVLVWYQVIFLLSIIPLTVLGGRLRRPN